MLEQKDLQAIQKIVDASEQRVTKNTDMKINGVYTYLENRIEPQLKLLAERHSAISKQLAQKADWKN